MIIEIVDILAWPAAFIIAILIFKEQITNLFTRVDKFRWGKFEAEMEKVREEALATIEELRRLAVTLAIPIANSLSGFIEKRASLISSNSPSVNERLKQAKQINDALIDLGTEPSEANEIAFEPSLRHIRRIHISWLQDIVNEIHQPEKINLVRKNIDEDIFENLNKKAISIDHARTQVEINTAFTDELSEWFKDLEYFDKYNELRRPEIKPWN